MKQSASIELFLQLAKRYVKKGHLTLIPREQTERFISEHGVEPRDIEEIVLGLTVQDCFDGPEPDRDARYADHWSVAEFCPHWLGQKLYLKLSINVHIRYCRCLSIKPYTDTPRSHDGFTVL